MELLLAALKTNGLESAVTTTINKDRQSSGEDIGGEISDDQALNATSEVGDGIAVESHEGLAREQQLTGDSLHSDIDS